MTGVSALLRNIDFVPGVMSLEQRIVRAASILTVLLSTAVFLPQNICAQTLHRVEGKVLDAETGSVLPSANIRIVGSSRGTITNRDGAYLLQIAEGENVLIFSYVGYLSDTLKVQINRDISYDAYLQPTLIELPAVTVSGADAARAIIRRAIEARELTNRDLQSYRFQAFTRRVISREDSIAGIVEGYSFGYWREGETLMEDIRQSKVTENLPDMEGLQGVLDIQDFSLDDIELAGNRYVGPLHPNAFRWYDYTLKEVKLLDGLEIYLIAMEPRSRMVPLLRGTVEIADSTYALVGIDLVPAEPIVIPFVDELSIEWKQRFQKQEMGYWLPTDIRTNGSLKVGIGPINIPRIGFDQTSVIYDYDINISIPDSIFERQTRVSQLSEAAQIDSTFWERNQVLPLTGEEQHAYATLDSSKTLESLFAPEGFEMVFGDNSLTLSGSADGGRMSGLLTALDLRFNRVEGTFLGYRTEIDSLIGNAGISVRAGMGLDSERWSWQAGLSLPFGRPADTFDPTSAGVGGIEVSLFDRVAASPDAGFYPELLNSLTAWLAKDDYHDYYASRGWRVDLSLVPRSLSSVDIFFTRERHTSLSVVSNWSLFQKDKPSRPNPQVSAEDARWTRYGIAFKYGIGNVAGLMADREVSLRVERGEESDVGSDLSYSRADAVVAFPIRTFTSRFLFSPQLIVRFGGGWSWGNLPRQLWGAPENALGIYSPPGALKAAEHREFAGKGYAVLTAEHNFRNLPFFMLGLRGLANKGLELIVHGAVARSWIESIALPSDKPYSEVGFGIGRIAELFRLDFTRRLVDPVGWSVTLSLTTFI